MYFRIVFVIFKQRKSKLKNQSVYSSSSSSMSVSLPLHPSREASYCEED